MFDYTLADARQKILTGHRIVPVMSPDDSLTEIFANPLPDYKESYPLTNIVLNGDDFWGITGGTNQPFLIGQGLAPAVVLGYTNSAPLYASMSAEPMLDVMADPSFSINICKLQQYKSFQFVARNDASLVWDGETPLDFDGVFQAIQQGSYFRLVFEDAIGLVFSLAVDLPMYFPGEAGLTINSHPSVFPDFFGNPQSLIQALEEAKSPMLDPEAHPGKLIRTTVNPSGGFFSLRADGTYYGVQDIITGTPKHWRQARLYAY